MNDALTGSAYWACRSGSKQAGSCICQPALRERWLHRYDTPRRRACLSGASARASMLPLPADWIDAAAAVLRCQAKQRIAQPHGLDESV